MGGPPIQSRLPQKPDKYNGDVMRFAPQRISWSLLLTMAVLLSMAVPLLAATTSGQTSVSCDGTTIKTVTTVDHSGGGTLSVRQNWTDPTSNTWVSARSGNDQDLAWKLASDGGTVSWTGVIGSNYTIRALRSGSQDCNGFWFGHGNYTWNYRVTHNP